MASNNNEEESNLAVNNYLDGMSIKELLETAEEYAIVDNLVGIDRAISARLETGWKNGVPYEDMSVLIKDKSHNDLFRGFVIDVATKTNNQEGYKSHDIADGILTVAEDENEKDTIRRYALLNLRKQGSYNEKENINESRLLKIFNDNEAPDIVRGASITAMRRTGDPNFKIAISKVLSKPENYNNETIRFTVTEASNAGLTQYLETIKTITEATTDPEVYKSSILALGTFGNKEAIRAIVASYNRFGEENICKYVLMHNLPVILSMLDANESNEIINDGILAVQSIDYSSKANDALEKIINTTKDLSIKEKADDALNIIKATPNADEFYSNWEVK